MPLDLEKIGSILKQERELKGLTLADISEKLCVRKSLIDALESGSWDMLPHEVYVRGYIKEYAHLLGNYEEISVELAQREEAKAPVEVPIQLKTETKAARMPKRAILYPLALVLLVGFVILSQMNKDRPIAQIQQAEHQSQIVNQAANNVVRENQTPVSEVSTIKKLMITCQERTWVSVVIDDNEKKEFILNPEDIVILNAKTNYDLLIGNAAGVKLILDGKNVEVTGVSGEVKRIKLS